MKIFVTPVTLEQALREAGEAVIQRVGSQYGGRFQWLSARLPRAISLQLDGQTDRLEKSLLFCTSHDTSSGFVVRFGLRKNDTVMCNFTAQEIRIQHRGVNVASIKTHLGIEIPEPPWEHSMEEIYSMFPVDDDPPDDLGNQGGMVPGVLPSPESSKTPDPDQKDSEQEQDQPGEPPSHLVRILFLIRNLLVRTRPTGKKFSPSVRTSLKAMSPLEPHAQRHRLRYRTMRLAISTTGLVHCPV